MGGYASDVANLADVVLTIVGIQKMWEEVSFGDQGIFKSLKSICRGGGSYNKYTNFAKRIAEEAAATLLGSARRTCIRRGPWC